MNSRVHVIACVVLVSVFAWTSVSPAQTAPAPQPAAPPPSAPGDEYTGPPNRGMLGIGLLTLTMAYVPAIVVASNSNATDGAMFAPLAGPWIDLGSRPGCGYPGVLSCSAETWSRALIIADGVAQAWGLFATALSFFQKESHDSKVQVAPSVGGSGYGVAAFGSF